MKPLNAKVYGSIGHLPDSKLGPGDHRINDGQARILTVKARDKHDVVTVEQKVDGACVGVAKDASGCLHFLQRAGHTASSSPHEHLRKFDQWARANYQRFDDLLVPGERVAGEWLAMAHSIRYALPHEPFVAFDLFTDATTRAPWRVRCDRVRAQGFSVPQLVHRGGAIPTAYAVTLLDPKTHGAIDPPEGLVYRIERKGVFDFAAKWVRPDFVPGRFFDDAERMWNTEVVK